MDFYDKTQLYESMAPDDFDTVENIFNCIEDVKDWMAANFLKHNKDKTKILLIGLDADRKGAMHKLQDSGRNLSHKTKNLGVLFLF